MSERQAPVRPLVPFDQYYDVMKRCVEDKDVQAAIFKFRDLNDEYYRNGGDYDSREESVECWDAFQGIGLAIDKAAVRQGFPSRHGMPPGNTFDNYIIQFVWRDWPTLLPYDIDIHDKEAVRQELKARKSIDGTNIDFGDDK